MVVIFSLLNDLNPQLLATKPDVRKIGFLLLRALA
jgi:hypothetical protein